MIAEPTESHTEPASIETDLEDHSSQITETTQTTSHSVSFSPSSPKKKELDSIIRQPAEAVIPAGQQGSGTAQVTSIMPSGLAPLFPPSDEYSPPSNEPAFDQAEMALESQEGLECTCASGYPQGQVPECPMHHAATDTEVLPADQGGTREGFDGVFPPVMQQEYPGQAFYANHPPG